MCSFLKIMAVLITRNCLDCLFVLDVLLLMMLPSSKEFMLFFYCPLSFYSFGPPFLSSLLFVNKIVLAFLLFSYLHCLNCIFLSIYPLFYHLFSSFFYPQFLLVLINFAWTMSSCCYLFYAIEHTIYKGCHPSFFQYDCSPTESCLASWQKKKFNENEVLPK